jgi:hypothetical protein
VIQVSRTVKTWDEFLRMSAQELEEYFLRVWRQYPPGPFGVLLEMKEHPEDVRKLPDGNIEILSLFDKNGNRVHSFEDADHGWGNTFTPDLITWVAESYYAPWSLERHRKKKQQEKAEASLVSVPAAPSLAAEEDSSSEFAAARSAERALAASVGEAKYDTNEELRIAWEQHLAGQGIHATPEEMRRRFIEAHVLWKTGGTGMLPSADAVFFQTHGRVFRL